MAWVEILPDYTTLFRARLGFRVLVSRLDRHLGQQAPPSPGRTSNAGIGAFYLKKEDRRFVARSLSQCLGRLRLVLDGGARGRHAASLAQGRHRLPRRGRTGRRSSASIHADARGCRLDRIAPLLPKLADVDKHRLADTLGQELPRMHDAGFDHPDLFAKHILAASDGTGFRLCILDWQRSRHRSSVSSRSALPRFGGVDATLHEALASDRLRLRLSCMPI